MTHKTPFIETSLDDDPSCDYSNEPERALWRTVLFLFIADIDLVHKRYSLAKKKKLDTIFYEHTMREYLHHARHAWLREICEFCEYDYGKFKRFAESRLECF